MPGLSLCYMTPTFGPDIERFALLRYSLRAFSPDILHMAFVDTEDLALFRARFGGEPGLRLVATAEVLPPRVEAQRRFWRSWRGRLADRVVWRLGRLGLGQRAYSGWKLQQIVKLYAAAKAESDAVVFLDSDIFLCGPVAAADYMADADLRLLETPAKLFEDYAFEVSCRILVGERLNAPADANLYIHQAPRFLRRTAMALLAHLEGTHQNWTARFYEQPFPSEYNLLGYAARVLEGYHGYRREMTPSEEWLYEVKERSQLAGALEACSREQGRRKFFLVQSNMQLPEHDYIPAARALIDTLTGRSEA
jgi:hypothetical protein